MCGPTAVAAATAPPPVGFPTGGEEEFTRTKRSPTGTVVMEGWLKKRCELQGFQQLMYDTSAHNEFQYHQLALYPQFPEPAVLLETFEKSPAEGGRLLESMELWSCEKHCTLSWQKGPATIWRSTDLTLNFKVHQANHLEYCVNLEAKNQRERARWIDALETTVPEQCEVGKCTPRGVLSPRSASVASVLDLDVEGFDTTRSHLDTNRSATLLDVKAWLPAPFPREELTREDCEAEGLETEAKARARTQVEVEMEPMGASAVRLKTAHEADADASTAEAREAPEAKPPVLDPMARAYGIMLLGTLGVTATAATGVLALTHPAIFVATGTAVGKALGVHSASSGAASAAAAPPAAPPPEPLTTQQQVNMVYLGLGGAPMG